MCVGVNIRIYMCYPQEDGLNTSLSRVTYLILYTVLQLFSCTRCPVVHLYLIFVQYQVPCVLGAHDECYINYVYLCISSPYINHKMNSTPYPNVRALGLRNTPREGILDCPGARTSECTKRHGKQHCLPPHEQPKDLERKSRCKNS